MLCRTIAEVEAAAAEDGRDEMPLSQAQADLLAAILARHPAPEDDAEARRKRVQAAARDQRKADAA